MRCINCGNRGSIMCECRDLNCCACNKQVCTRCCTALRPQRTHNPINMGEDNIFTCRVCYRDFSLLPRADVARLACTCCRAIKDRCYACCDAYRHACCRAQAIHFSGPHALTFISPPLLGASNKEPRTLLTREASLEVLTKRYKINPKYLKRNRSCRYASVEIEASTIKDARNINSAVSDWHCAVVRDRTTGDNGFEINTTPACGDILPEQLEQLCAALIEGKARVTAACGLHVHIDCRDYGYQEIQRFLKVYSLIEPALFAAVHPDRELSEFCYPCGAKFYDKFISGIKPYTKDIKKTLIPVVYGPEALSKVRGTSLPAFHNTRLDHYGRIAGARNIARYSAVNLHSWFLRGTLEFRMHHAAIDFIEVYGWTKLLITLLDSILNLPESKMQDILNIKPIEREGFQELYKVKVSKKVCDGLIVLRSLLYERVFLHLISKINLINDMKNDALVVNHLPAQLFYNHRCKVKPNWDITEKLTTV